MKERDEIANMRDTKKSSGDNIEKVIELLPLLQKEGEIIHVLGSIDRTLAHGKNPSYHATAVIVAVLPDGKLLFADKTDKQLAKNSPVPKGKRIIDIVGGHMGYEDVSDDEKEHGLGQRSFRLTASRELSEELLKDGKPLDVKQDKLLPMGFYVMENDHNLEYSWVYLYMLEEDVDVSRYTSVDTLVQDGVERILDQPVICLDAEETIRIVLEGDDQYVIWDGFHRMIKADHGEKMLELLVQQGIRKKR